MAFWQSPAWCSATTSLYPFGAPGGTLPAWREAILLWKHAPAFDVVMTMGARESLAYGLLCAATGRASKQIMTEVFIDHPRPANPLWRFKLFCYRLVARRAIGILTNSSVEVDSIARRFQISTDRMRYLPMHTNIEAPAPSTQNDGFVLSAGYTLRDYGILLCAAGEIKAPVIILCGRRDIRHELIPPNVTVMRNVGRETYLDYLKRCALVALPLHATERSTGQVVFLEAMAFAKPVVATRSAGTVDYIRQDENGILIEPGDARGLAGAVNSLLNNLDLATKIGMAGYHDVLAHYTIEQHARNRLAAIQELFKSNAHPSLKYV